jgi:hypothetical protein
MVLIAPYTRHYTQFPSYWTFAGPLAEDEEVQEAANRDFGLPIKGGVTVVAGFRLFVNGAVGGRSQRYT